MCATILVPEPSAGTLRMGTYFRIDTARRRLWNDAEEVPLAPKPLDVLCAFVERPGEILTREELQTRVWPDVRVTDGVLRYTIRQVRRALGDDAEHPAFLATVPRRGWKLIARVTADPTGARRLEPGDGALPPLRTESLPRCTGRAPEIRALEEALGEARAGKPHLVFLTGEAGIGKTTLLHHFLERADAPADTHVAIGECVAQYGSAEPYLPAIGALERLANRLGDEMTNALRRYAPAWLAQLPGLTDPEEHARLAPTVLGTTAGRMLRQFARALEALSQTQTIVLAFDDVHWADAASLELLSFLVRRPPPLRLLLVATLRPAEMAGHAGPLTPIKRDLQIHDLASELVLDGLPRTAVDDYVANRLSANPADDVTQRVGEFVHRWTEGNPLFMVNVVDQLVDRGALQQRQGEWILAGLPAALEPPSTIRRLIEEELDRVNPDHRSILEAASVAGMEFSAATIAAGSTADVETIETYCEELIDGGRFLRATGAEKWPDGTVASRYRFDHALYREILAEGIPAARRARLHREIGRRREQAWGDDTPRIAAELAHHFEQAGDTSRAWQYFAVAGDRAARRYANREATEYLRRSLRLLQTQPPSPERDTSELVVRLAASAPLAATQGYASPDLEANLERVRALGDQTEPSESSLPVLLGLWSLHIVRADLAAATAIGAELLTIAGRSCSPITRLQAHRVVGGTQFFAGEFQSARQHLDASLEAYDVDAHEPLDYSYGDDPVVLALSYSALVAWFEGTTDRALSDATRAVRTARDLRHPPSLAFALSYSGILQQLLGDAEAALDTAAELIALTDEEILPLWASVARVVRGWAWTATGDAERGAEELQAGLAGWEATGADLARPHYMMLLAQALGGLRRVDEALEMLQAARGLIARTGQYAFEAECWRTEAEIRSAARRPGGEECLEQAARAAARVSAPTLERLVAESQMRASRIAGPR